MLFGRLKTQRLLLEFDDGRSGSFEPLRDVPADKFVVLGLVTTKRPELETEASLKRRIADASRYFPRDQLGLSPQCGFASSIIGNNLSPGAQSRKLELVVRTAQAVWGTQ